MNQQTHLFSYILDPYDHNILTRDDEGKLLRLEQYFRDPDGKACIFIDKQAPGVYNVRIVESIATGTFVAYGTVEVSDNGEFRVNGVLNGPLHDKYGDSFDIYPRVYKHFFGLPLLSGVDFDEEAEVDREAWMTEGYLLRSAYQVRSATIR